MEGILDELDEMGQVWEEQSLYIFPIRRHVFLHTTQPCEQSES